MEVRLGKHASVSYYKLQNDHATANHHSTISIEQQESSQLQMFSVDLGSLSAVLF